MKKFIQAAVCGTLFAMPVTAAAGCDGGVVTNHTVQVLYAGFFPTKIYVCEGDTITFENNSGRWATFSVEPLNSGTDIWTYNYTQPGGSRTMTVPAGTKWRLDDLDLAQVSNHTYDGFIYYGSAPTGG